jgi:hypothetical protein
MAEQVAWSENKPESIARLLSFESSGAAYFGRLRKARELNQRAVESAERADNEETAANWRMGEALCEAAFGNLAEARQTALAALSQPAQSQKLRGNKSVCVCLDR